jgi:hypothetical protein
MSIVQAWQKSAVPPSRPPPERVDEPSSALRLYWMYGFRALDCRQQVKYARPWGLPAATVLEQAVARGGHDNLVCFFGGAVAAVLDASNNSMTFHRDHSDEVLLYVIYILYMCICKSVCVCSFFYINHHLNNHLHISKHI